MSLKSQFSPLANPSSLVSKWIKSPRAIHDNVPLQEQVKQVSLRVPSWFCELTVSFVQCILADTNYGPLGENIKQYPKYFAHKTTSNWYNTVIRRAAMCVYPLIRKNPAQLGISMNFCSRKK